MTKALFILLITISGMVGIDPSSHYSSSSLSFDQLISDKHSSLLHENFKRNASSPSSWISDFSNDFNSFTSNQTRFKRAADPLSDYSGKLSTVARISNGISLLAGLVNKNIPINAAIEELLHFGTVKLSEVLAFQKDKVEAVISQLESTKQSLVVSGKMIALEDNTIGLARVREAYKEVGDFGSFQHPTGYFSEATAFEADTSTDYSVFQKASTEITNVLTRIGELEKAPTITDMNSGDYSSHIKNVQRVLNTLGTGTGSFETIVNGLDAKSNLMNGEAWMKPVKQMLDLLETHASLSSVAAKNANDLAKSFGPISSLSSTLVDVQSNFIVNLKNFVSSRIHRPTVKLQFTSGFPNGASDLEKLTKDIRDPAFESTIGGGKNFARLSGGLKPLVDWSAKLKATSALFTPIATSAVLQSASNAAKLQKKVAGLSVTSADAVSVIKMFADNEFKEIAAQMLTPVAQLVANAKKLQNELNTIKSSASAFTKPPQAVSDVKTILAKLPSVNGPEHVQTVIEELKSVPDKMKAVTEYLIKLEKLGQQVPVSSATRQIAKSIIDAESELKDFKTEVDGDAVKKLNNMKNSKDPVDAVVKAIEACKIVRSFEKSDIDNIRSAVDTITKTSGSLKELQKPPANRKKRQTDEVKELVKLKDSQKTSAALGSAAITISSMTQLKGMETTVVQDLKSKSTIFDTEVGKIQDQQKKSDILNKWGDHTAFTSSLDSTINQIKAFAAKLSVDKDLRKLGAHLNDAKAVGDVKQNIADKSEAVSMLISETATPNADLQALKTQLDTLAALDLQFSNHHSAFPDVQGALKSFFDFVTGFVTPKKQSAQAAAAAGAAGAAAAAADSSVLAYSLGGVGGVVGLILIGGVSVFVYWKITKDKKKPWELIEKKWIFRIYFKKAPDSAGFARSLMNEMLKEVRQLKTKKGDPLKMRSDKILILLEATAVSLPDGRFINANWITSQGGARFIATQGPLEKKFGEKKKDKEGKKLPREVLKEDTREDFLYMCVTHEVEFIVQLCDFEELYETLAERRKRLAKWKVDAAGVAEKKNANGKRAKEKYERAVKSMRAKWTKQLNRLYRFDKSGKYYSPKKGTSMTVGKYNVLTEDVIADEDYFGNPVEERKLVITDTKEKNFIFKCTHLFHRAWPDLSVPDDASYVVGMMNKVRFSKKPIVVHCSTGAGRSVSFIGSDVIACDAQRHPGKKTADMFKLLRQSRLNGMQTAAQAHFAVEVAHGLLIDEYKRRGTESEEKYKKHLQVMEAARVLLETEDEVVRKEEKAAEEKARQKLKGYPTMSESRQQANAVEPDSFLNPPSTGNAGKETPVEPNSFLDPPSTGEAGKETPVEAPVVPPVEAPVEAPVVPPVEAPVEAPKSRETGGADHVAIDME